MKKFVIFGVKAVLPPILTNLIKSINATKWKGDFPSWFDAQSASAGYSSDKIINKSFDAAKKVFEGKAAYERDSVLFYEKDYNWRLLTFLFFCMSKNNGKLRVLDFGGSFASTYLQHRDLLNKAGDFDWVIVEQKKVVKKVKNNFKMSNLRFTESINMALKNKIDLVLFSSSLQYVENPDEIINKVKEAKIKFIFVDRTPLTNLPQRICVQEVDSQVYKASYPCRIFNKRKFVNLFAGYNIISSFKNDDYSEKWFNFEGIMWVLKK